VDLGSTFARFCRAVANNHVHGMLMLHYISCKIDIILLKKPGRPSLEYTSLPSIHSASIEENTDTFGLSHGAGGRYFSDGESFILLLLSQ